MQKRSKAAIKLHSVQWQMQLKKYFGLIIKDGFISEDNLKSLTSISQPQTRVRWVLNFGI